MITNNILQTSKIILLSKVAYSKYCLSEERLNGIWKNSALYIKTKRVLNVIVVIFQYSFVGRIVEMNEGNTLREDLGNSKIVRWLFGAYNYLGGQVAEYFKTSLIVKHAIEFKNEFYVLSVKTGSIIVVVAVLSNLFFYALFKNTIQTEIGLLGWFIKCMLLFLGLAGLFCDAGLKGLISTSLFLKWTNHHKQSKSEDK